MTTAESVANARLDERVRIAELAEERADELLALMSGRPISFALFKDLVTRIEALRDFAAELRRP